MATAGGGDVRFKLVLAGICAAVALVALLIARDAWHWDKAMRDAGARAQVAPLGPRAWSAATTVPFDPARRLLGIEDDLEFRRLYATAWLAASRPAPSKGTSPRPPAEAALGRVSRTDTNPQRSSAAANLLGVLFFTDPDDPEASPAERAVAAFQDAALLDPTNAVAKTNLELILRQLTSSELKGRSSPGGGDTGGKGGAGLAPGGKGY